MSGLPIVSGLAAAKAFVRLGWRIDRQHGSHLILEKPGSEVRLSIPQHPELKRGLLRQLIRDADVRVDEFVDAL